MGITITRQPQQISWSRNPIIFEFYTDKVVQNLGRPLVFSLDFSQVENTPTIVIVDEVETIYRYEDWGFTLIAGGTELQFVCTYNPTDNNFSIPHRITNPNESKSAWLGRVKDVMLKTFNLGTLFTAAVVGESISFFSGDTNEVLYVELKDVIETYPITLDVAQTSVPIQYTPNLKIFVELMALDPAGNVVNVVSAALVPDLNGIAMWDLSKPLSSFCLAGGPDIPPLFSNAVSNGGGVREYWIRATELYGEPQIPRNSILTDHFHVVQGGLPKQRQNMSLVESLTDVGVVNFMTTSKFKKLLPGQPFWLSWINLSDELSEVKLVVELIYNDGTPLPFDAHVFGSIGKYEKVSIPIGLEQLGANTFYPELTVVSYSVYLQHNGTKISNELHFEVDNRFLQYQRIFLFQNSMGAFETFYTYGKKSSSYDIEKNSARIYQVKDFNLENGENIDLDITLENKEKINTGYKSRSEIQSVRDFILSRWKLTYIDGRWWPVSIASSAIEEFTDGNGLYALSFEINSQHTQELFFEN